MIYLDTSVLVALHVGEVHTPQTLDWFSRNEHQLLMISEFVSLEFACALRRKLRMNRLGPDDLRRAESKFASTVATSMVVVGIPGDCFLDAISMVRESTTPLRAADALHLAIAKHHGAALVTLDRGLAVAARNLKAKVLDIHPLD